MENNDNLSRKEQRELIIQRLYECDINKENSTLGTDYTYVDESVKGVFDNVEKIDEIIALIKASKTPEIAREGLIKNYSLSEIQARAILDLRLQKLTGLEQDKQCPVSSV